MMILFRFKRIEYQIEGLNFMNIQNELEGRLARDFVESDDSFVLLKIVKNIMVLRGYVSRFQEVGINNCRAIISNKALVEALRAEHFDAVILSDFFISRCLHLIPQRLLQVPYASLGESQSPWDMRLPVLPVHFIGQEVSSPTFGNRLGGLVEFALRNALNLLLSPSLPEDLAGEVNETELDTNVIAQNAQLFLYYHDEILTGYLLPKLPNMEFIGALTASPPKPIKDKEIADWASNANGGFILCSFGSHIAAINPIHLKKLFNLFEKLKSPVIMRLKPETIPSDIIVPENVLIREWLPQNDLLGHPNIRLFISHAGTNGIGETLYHGVPVLAIPFFGPQHIIAKRIEAQGYVVVI